MRSSHPSSPGVQPEAVVWHTLENFEVLEYLDVVPEIGLSASEAARRREIFGSNELSRGQSSRWLHKSWIFLINPLFWGMAGTAVLAFFSWGPVLGLLLGVCAGSYALLALLQDDRRERTLESLNRITTQRVQVRRDGQVIEVYASHLVPGDVIQLKAGDVVPADARLLESANLQVQEAILTGSHHSVNKVPQAVRSNGAPLHERHNLVHMGSGVVHGRGQAVVIRTGMQTELGGIASLVLTAKNGTPPLLNLLQKVSMGLALAALGICASILAIGEFNRGLRIDLAAGLVAVLPAGLPLLFVTQLILGSRRVHQSGAQVRRLSTVAQLGQVSAICTDKSGGLMENRMRIRVEDASGKPIEYDHWMKQGHPVLLADDERFPSPDGALGLLLTVSALCTPGDIERDEDSPDDFRTIGYPADGALLVAAARSGLWKSRLERLFPRLMEAPYSPGRSRASSMHEVRIPPHVNHAELPLASSLLSQHKPFVVVAKGEPASLLQACSRIWISGHVLAITDAHRQEVLTAGERMSAAGLVVSAFAYRPMDRLPALVEDYRLPLHGFPSHFRDLPRGPRDIPQAQEASQELEQDLILVGLVGVMEVPQADALQCVQACREAGIHLAMTSTDASATTLQAARSLGILLLDPTSSGLYFGAELEKLPAREFEAAVLQGSVFAGISPELRLRIVQALQNAGNIVAATGEGLDDAPSLNSADIGMTTGSDPGSLTHESANLINLDGRFRTILRAIQLGREVSVGISRYLVFVCNRSSALTIAMLLGLFYGFGLVLNPFQALWIVLVSDCLAGLSLGAVPAQTGLSAPVSSARQLPSLWGLWIRSSLPVSVGISLLCVAAAFWARARGEAGWQTFLFSLLFAQQAGAAVSISSNRLTSIFARGRSDGSGVGTPWLAWLPPAGLFSSLALQFLIVSHPAFQTLFAARSLPPIDWIAVLAAGLITWAILRRT